MSSVAFEAAVRFEHRLRTVRGEPDASPVGATPDEPKSASDAHIQPWELHSELVLVCPEVCERARELLPERDPDAFLAGPREPDRLPAAGTVDEAGHTTSLPLALGGYAVWRLFETARIALFTIGGVVALALLADALH